MSQSEHTESERNALLIDPQWLALLLRGFQDYNEKHRRNLHALTAQYNDSKLATDNKILRRSAPVLDSLARLLISEESDQIVSVTLVPPDGDDPPEFFVAENGRIPVAAAEQLTTIVRHLRTARTLYVQGGGGLPKAGGITLQLAHPDEAEPTLLTSELLRLERALHRHCWNKEQRRLVKDGRVRRFEELVEDVRGVPAGSRGDLAPKERAALEALQGVGEADLTTLESTLASLKMLETSFKSSPDSAATVDGTTHRFVDVLIDHMRQLDGEASENSVLWALCDNYIGAKTTRQHVVREQATRAANQPYTTPTTPLFSVGRWLTKVTSVTRDFRQILRAILSPTIAALIEGVEPKVSCLPPRTVSRRTLKVSKELVKSTLKLAGWSDLATNDSDTDTDTFLDEFMEAFKSKYAKRDRRCSSSASSLAEPSSPAVTTTGDTWEYDAATVLHCECVVLAKLHELAADRRIIPYVGVSKLSCALCDAYFDCYRTATRAAIYTAGTHGQLTNWATPSLSTDPTMDQRVRETLLGWLQTRLVVEATNAKGRGGSSQSTVASDPGIVAFETRTRKANIAKVAKFQASLAAQASEDSS
ncbi:hypothetical protein K466DRAFT_663331 [Polyporus arcularius HHB13444]|uniref:Uncharacterized protein n=1 Tax=Polyporus arcularius HHB13444 TaxID=1314778 RepID=A0A5C3PEK3_9APHY|nr:hypothetical protein K466DRAFT_663331 [Polyporus arcularius HHB13444]